MPKHKKPRIDYASRDYDSIRDELEVFAKRYYPDTYKDFNDASFGALLIDTVSYIGDQLSFYIDFQANESFIQTAQVRENIQKHAYSLGWTGSRNSSTTGMCDFYVVVPSNTTGLGPDPRYIPTLRSGTSIRLANVPFILTQDIDFSHPSNEVVVARTNAANGSPLSYAIKATGPIISGEYVTTTKTTGAYSKFLNLQIKDSSFSEIISVRDNNGNLYYEVQSLDQNTIYFAVNNSESDAATTAKKILRPVVVPRRFVVKSSPAGAVLTFGYGTESSEPSVADPSAVVLNSYGKDYISDTSFSPEKLLQTDKFGISPQNARLTIVYRRTPPNSSVALSAEGLVVSPKFYFKDANTLDTVKMNSVKSSIECTNNEQIIGTAGMTDYDIVADAQNTFTRQNRAVTMKDYKSLIYSMANSFGKIARCHVMQDHDSFKRNINVYILSLDTNGNLAITPDITKNNLKVWINDHKMMNDTVDILDAKIVNLSVSFSVKAIPGEDHSKIYSSCVTAIRQRVAFDKFEIGENFPIADLYRALGTLSGVQDVVSVTINRPIGANYSDTKFNIEKNTSANGREVICPLNVAFEVKFPSRDIAGVIS